MADEKQKPQKGDWVLARKVKYGDYRDEDKDEGVVTGLPRPGNGGYYDILNRHQPDKPFQGHSDDIEVVPDDLLTPQEESFKKEVKRQINSNR